MSDQNTAKQNTAIANLLTAEVAFLIAFGWVPYSSEHWGRPSIRWTDAQTGDHMDLWSALAKQKMRVDYDQIEPNLLGKGVGDLLGQGTTDQIVPGFGEVKSQYEIAKDPLDANYGPKGRATLSIVTTIDGREAGTIFVTSGTFANIEAFVTGRIRLDTLKARCDGPPEGSYGDTPAIHEVLDAFPMRTAVTLEDICHALQEKGLVPSNTIPICFTDWAVREHGAFRQIGDSYTKPFANTP